MDRKSLQVPRLYMPMGLTIVAGVVNQVFCLYAMNPPNPIDCYADSHSSLLYPERQDAIPTINVTRKFHSFFWMMFTSCSFLIISNIFQVFSVVVKSEEYYDFALTMHAINFCLFATGVIFGTQNRYSLAGKVCSGDFEQPEYLQPYVLESEGKFIRTFLVLTYMIGGTLGTWGFWRFLVFLWNR